MSSRRTYYRLRNAEHQQRQINYLDNLPDNCVFSSDSQLSLEVNTSSSSSEYSEMSSFSIDVENNLINPPRAKYIETLFETLFSHIGLNLSEAEKVICLFNCLYKRFPSTSLHQLPFKDSTLPSLRYYWDKKAKSSGAHVYVLCDRKHSHGPFIGEPKYFQDFSCENELIQVEIKPGKYFLHCPLKKQLKEILPFLPQSCWMEDSERKDVSNSEQAMKVKVSCNSSENHIKFTLTIHADEVSSGKSSSEKIFPIFFTVNEMKPEFRKKFFLLVGLYVGRTKPPVECFLGPIIDELIDLSNNPIEFNQNSSATFHLIALVADAPMRAYLRNVKQYNHMNGCDWCLIEASTTGGARLYSNQTETELNLLKRDKEDFLLLKERIQNQVEDVFTQLNSNPRFRGLAGISPLLSLQDFDIVNGTAVEPMHCISLGIFRNLLSRGIFQSNAVSCFERSVDVNFAKKELSDRICSISVPSEFTRIPRDIFQLKHWKSNEYDAFLAYFIFPTTRGIFTNAIINHFVCLARIYYLSHTGGTQSSSIQEIKNLVEEFQAGCASIYGCSFLSYNLHILSHLADSLKNLGPNSNISSYPLEDYMRILKEKVHRYSNLGPSLIRFFMSDFRYKEFKTTRLEKWNLTSFERKAFGCENMEEKITKIVDKFQPNEVLNNIVELIRSSSGNPNLQPDELTFFKTYKKAGKRYSTESYCRSKKRDDSKISDLSGNHYVIKHIVTDAMESCFFICRKYSDMKVKIKFKGKTGEFSFEMDHIHEVQRLDERLFCLDKADVKAKFIYVKSTTFHHKYARDFLVDQFLWNK